MKNRRLQKRQLAYIGITFVHEWEDLAALLGLEDKDVSDIKEDHSKAKARKRAMLSEWQQRFAPHDTVENLIKGFCDLKQLDTAQHVLDYLGTTIIALEVQPLIISILAYRLQ